MISKLLSIILNDTSVLPTPVGPSIIIALIDLSPVLEIEFYDHFK
jgi:hypothetical protein